MLVPLVYDTLGLQTYFTSGPTETRAWTIKKGATAPQVCSRDALTGDHVCVIMIIVWKDSVRMDVVDIHLVIHRFISNVLRQAAGEIHTDFEKGFIRAETCSYADLVAHGSEKAVKDAGAMRSEGKEYVMRDGDVVLFRFNN